MLWGFHFIPILRCHKTLHFTPFRTHPLFPWTSWIHVIEAHIVWGGCLGWYMRAPICHEINYTNWVCGLHPCNTEHHSTCIERNKNHKSSHNVFVILIANNILILQLSINGDKEFLDDVKVQPYHLTPVIAVAISQPEESKEAGPLPVKVDLNKTSI